MGEVITFKKEFLKQLQGMRMSVSLKLQGGMQGGRRSTMKGNSLEFSDFRQYGLGDDFRRIDWAAYGRLDKLYVKEFMEEKEALFHLFLDLSASMAFGGKEHKSLEIAAALGYIILQGQDRLSIRLLKGEELTISGGRHGFSQLLERLHALHFNSKEALDKQILQQTLIGRGVSIIISDFWLQGNIQTLEKALTYLRYKKQSIIMVQVLSQEEREPEELGDFELIDSETQKSVKVTLNPETLKAYKLRLAAYNDQLMTVAQKYGAVFLQVKAEDTIEHVILQEFCKRQIIY